MSIAVREMWMALRVMSVAVGIMALARRVMSITVVVSHLMSLSQSSKMLLYLGRGSLNTFNHE